MPDWSTPSGSLASVPCAGTVSIGAIQVEDMGPTSSGNVTLGGVSIHGPHTLCQFLAPVVAVWTLLQVGRPLVAPVVLKGKEWVSYLTSAFLLSKHIGPRMGFKTALEQQAIFFKPIGLSGTTMLILSEVHKRSMYTLPEPPQQSMID